MSSPSLIAPEKTPAVGSALITIKDDHLTPGWGWTISTRNNKSKMIQNLLNVSILEIVPTAEDVRNIQPTPDEN